MSADLAVIDVNQGDCREVLGVTEGTKEARPGGQCLYATSGFLIAPTTAAPTAATAAAARRGVGQDG